LGDEGEAGEMKRVCEIKGRGMRGGWDKLGRGGVGSGAGGGREADGEGRRRGWGREGTEGWGLRRGWQKGGGRVR